VTGETRSTEVVVDIGATTAEVWKALTEADQLTQWFPLQADVRGGLGGKMVWHWDGSWSWSSEIERWDPGVALTLVNRDQRPFDVEGRVLPENQVAPATLRMEFTLETVRGRTRLRLVHSGFGWGASWDDEFDGVSVGWQFELRSLKLYLERHRGGRRRVGRASISSPATQPEVWRRLVGEGGFRFDHWPLLEGDEYRLRAATGDRYTGRVYGHLPDRDLSLITNELGLGLLRLGTHRSGGRTGVMVWIASYSADPGFVDELGSRNQRLLDELFTR